MKKNMDEKKREMLESINGAIFDSDYWWSIWDERKDANDYCNWIKHHYAVDAKVEMFNIVFDMNYNVYTIQGLIDEYGIK